MKAMILAAGLGTRLKPYTNHKPKALIEINGTPMVEYQIKKLIKAGVTDIIINVHHFGDMITNFVRSKNNFGTNIQFSIEPKILGTGGGIKKAAHFFNDGNPFLVHNVDIFTNVDYADLYRYHLEKHHLITLAVKKRSTERYFIVNQDNLICGHINKRKNIKRIVKKTNGTLQELAFSGIHVISPEFFSLLLKDGYFSIIDEYLRLIADGYPIGVYRMDFCYWKDLGKIESLKNIETDIINGLI